MRKHLVKVLKQKIDEKVDLASTVKAAFPAIDDESLDNNVYIDYLKQLFEEKDARIEPFLINR